MNFLNVCAIRRSSLRPSKSGWFGHCSRYATTVPVSAAVNAGMIWLAVVAVVFSLVGAYYYLRIVKLMYFDEPVITAPVYEQPLGVRVLMSTNGLALLALGILPQPLMALCLVAIKSL